jgi:hypothetical protein
MPRALMNLIWFFLSKASIQLGPDDLDIVVAKFCNTLLEGSQRVSFRHFDPCLVLRWPPDSRLTRRNAIWDVTIEAVS